VAILSGSPGLGLRIFIINDDDAIRRFPFSRYERLLQGDSKERLLQYAGKKIRFAELAVEFYQRRPIKIVGSKRGRGLISD